MTKLIRMNHMTGDTVTPRHFNALVDVLNALAGVVETHSETFEVHTAILEELVTTAETLTGVNKAGTDE